MDRGGVGRHHIGAIGEPGDAAEALGLALRDESRLGGVKALELGVLLRHDTAQSFQREAIRHVVDGEPVRRHLMPRVAAVH